MVPSHATTCRTVPSAYGKPRERVPGVSQPLPAAGCAPPTSPHPPGSSWSNLKRRNNTGSSRAPSRRAHHAPAIRQWWTGPGFVEAAPALPGGPQIRLPPASPHRYSNGIRKLIQFRHGGVATTPLNPGNIRLRSVAQLEGLRGDVDVEFNPEHSREPGQGGQRWLVITGLQPGNRRLVHAQQAGKPGL